MEPTRAAIAGFDEESETYTLVLASGQRLFYVRDEEITYGSR